MLLPLAVLGCRTDPNQVLLEQESRMLEDKVYHLEALLDDCHAAREATIRENEALKKELAGGDRGPGADLGGPSIGSPAGDREPPSRPRRGEAPKLEAPTIELPEPSDTPPVEISPGGDEATVVEGQVTQLVINSRLTGGLDRDGKDGDEGILVVFEPRDAEGRLVKTPGAVSVVVMDPALEGDAARVARWDFEAGEVADHFHNTVFGRGLQFELPWPAAPPAHRDVKVFVRYTTPDGQKITSDAKIDVRAPSDPPRVDRETKNWSATQSARRPARKRAASSRLKSSRATTEAPAYRPAPDAGDAPQEAHHSADLRGDESAGESGRPVWKPYR